METTKKPLSTFWKVMIGIAIALVIVLAVGLGCVIWGIQWMQSSARTVYGGPFASGISALEGADFQSERMAIFADNNHKTLIIMAEKLYKPRPKGLPFSDADIKKALASFDSTGQIRGLIKLRGDGNPDTLMLGKSTVHVLEQTNSAGRADIVGVLNLDDLQLAFNCMGMTPTNPTPKDVADFFNTMPIIQKDSHLRHS